MKTKKRENARGTAGMRISVQIHSYIFPCTASSAEDIYTLCIYVSVQECEYISEIRRTGGGIYVPDTEKSVIRYRCDDPDTKWTPLDAPAAKYYKGVKNEKKILQAKQMKSGVG